MGQVHNLNRAHDYLEMLCAAHDPDSDVFQQAIALLCREAVLLRNDKELLKFALKGAATRGSSELCLELGRYFEQAEDYGEAILWYHNACEETESLMSLKASTTEPLERMAYCYEKLGMTREAEQCRNRLGSCDG